MGGQQTRRRPEEAYKAPDLPDPLSTRMFRLAVERS
jgi:hypothetical protein